MHRYKFPLKPVPRPTVSSTTDFPQPQTVSEMTSSKKRLRCNTPVSPIPNRDNSPAQEEQRGHISKESTDVKTRETDTSKDDFPEDLPPYCETESDSEQRETLKTAGTDEPKMEIGGSSTITAKEDFSEHLPPYCETQSDSEQRETLKTAGSDDLKLEIGGSSTITAKEDFPEDLPPYCESESDSEQRETLKTAGTVQSKMEIGRSSTETAKEEFSENEDSSSSGSSDTDTEPEQEIAPKRKCVEHRSEAQASTSALPSKKTMHESTSKFEEKSKRDAAYHFGLFVSSKLLSVPEMKIGEVERNIIKVLDNGLKKSPRGVPEEKANSDRTKHVCRTQSMRQPLIGTSAHTNTRDIPHATAHSSTFHVKIHALQKNLENLLYMWLEYLHKLFKTSKFFFTMLEKNEAIKQFMKTEMVLKLLKSTPTTISPYDYLRSSPDQYSELAILRKSVIKRFMKYFVINEPVTLDAFYLAYFPKSGIPFTTNVPKEICQNIIYGFWEFVMRMRNYSDTVTQNSPALAPIEGSRSQPLQDEDSSSSSSDSESGNEQLLVSDERTDARPDQTETIRLPSFKRFIPVWTWRS